MSIKIENRDIIGSLFIKLSEWENKCFKEKEPGDFVRLICSDAKLVVPSLKDVIMNKPALTWQSLHTGDLAAFSNGENFILGIVMGVSERQFCFSDPQTSIVRITDFCETVDGYAYINGYRMIENG